jgi:ParB family chromosome partitioning protein
MRGPEYGIVGKGEWIGLSARRRRGMEQEAMTVAAADWQLDRLSPEARAAALRTARQEGLSLSEWLTRLVTTASAAQGVILPPETPADAVPAEPAEPAEPVEAAPVEAPAVPPPDEAPALEPQPPAAPLATAPSADVAPAPGARNEQTQLSLNFEGTVVRLPVEALVPGPCGTRRADDEAPAALIAAVAVEGVRQPLLVRPQPGSEERYEIVAGKRRWRAALRAGMAEVPAIVSALDDAQASLASLRENLRRGDLTPMEEARAYLRLLTQYALNVNDIIRATGGHRHYVVRALRLLGLPASVRGVLETRQLAMEQALLLIETAEPEALTNAILRDGLSVEETRRRLGTDATAEPQP